MADFDAITGGLEPGQLVIVAARPSVGKTAFALNVADHVAQRDGTVIFFSLEMQRRELTQRLIALRSGVSVSEMRAGQIDKGSDKGQWSRISACQASADGQRLFLIDRPAIGVPYVRAAARKIRRQHGLSLIVVDYLGLMRGEGQNRTQEIGSLSRGLKALAKELNVPIIALAQLNRGTEARQDRRPQLSDLRYSGEIEQDADIVAMLHQEYPRARLFIVCNAALDKAAEHYLSYVIAHGDMSDKASSTLLLQIIPSVSAERVLPERVSVHDFI